MPETQQSSPATAFPLALADRCVKCGLCLPHCPTYQLSQDEAESPRGRIALMQGLASGQLEASQQLQLHLDQCLSCRACEAVCPAEVPYGELIDAVRMELQTARPQRNRWLRWLAPWFIRPRRRRTLQCLLRLYQHSGLQALARWLLPARSLPGRMAALLPAIRPAPAAGNYPATGQARGSLQLFTGCISELVEGQVLADSIAVLNRLGYSVGIPATQTCCGALHQHNGMRSEAQALFAQNIGAFGTGSGRILGTATGCTAMLHEYGLFAEDAHGRAFAERVGDIHVFLAAHWDEQLQLTPLPGKALVHDPCSQRNVLKAGSAVYDLLSRIPQLEISALAGNQQCCGAAGSMMLSDPEQADQLLDGKLKAVSALGPDYLVSSNIGCAMHLGGALRRAGLRTQVIHPLSLLARQLR